MTGQPERWIVIPHWDDYQHYKDRDPPWIKDLRNQYDHDDYLGLTFHQRGVLQGLRHGYAASNGQLRDSTLALTRRLGQRVTRETLEALNHAGWIGFSASKPIALRYPSRASQEAEAETETKAETQDLEQDQELGLPYLNGKADPSARQHDGLVPIKDLVQQSLEEGARA